MRTTTDTYTGKPFRYDESLHISVEGVNTVGRYSRKGLVYLHPDRLTAAKYAELNPEA